VSGFALLTADPVAGDLRSCSAFPTMIARNFHNAPPVKLECIPSISARLALFRRGRDTCLVGRAVPAAPRRGTLGNACAITATSSPTTHRRRRKPCCLLAGTRTTSKHMRGLGNSWRCCGRQSRSLAAVRDDPDASGRPSRSCSALAVDRGKARFRHHQHHSTELDIAG